MISPDPGSELSSDGGQALGDLSFLRPAVDFGDQLVQPGATIDGRFLVISLVGAGGMGEVFRVTDRYQNHAIRALKVIRPEFSASQDYTQRFQREVGNLLAITHENVCRAYDLGIDRTTNPARLYYTMELVEGPTLDAHLEQNGPLPPRELEKLALGVIAGLEVAHANSLIHRDLKPRNIVLGANSRGLRPVILDFGLALHSALSDESADCAGTYHYMAPEQRAGQAITNRTDIFALGLVLYEAATNDQGRTAQGITDHLSSKTGDGLVRSVSKHLIPAVWARIILKCIHSNPGQRFGSVGEVRDAILWQRKVPRRIAIGLGTLTVAGLATGLKPRKPAGSDSLNKEAATAYERGLLHSRRLMPDELRKALNYFQRAVKIDPSYALAWAELSNTYSRLGDYGGLPCREAFEKGQAAAQEAIRTGPLLAESHAALGLVLSIDPRKWTQAEPSFERAIQLNPAYSSTYQWYGGHLARLGRTKDAIRQLGFAVAADPFSLPVSVVYGWMHYYDRQYGKAIERGEQTIDLDPNFLYGYILLARSFLETSRLPEAARACGVAARISVALSKVGKEASVVRSTFAGVAGRQGDRVTARAVAKELEKDRQNGEPIPVHYIASAFCEAGDYQEALNTMEQGSDDCETGVLYLRVYPPFDAIRELPGYKRLVHRLGYPDSEQRMGI